MKGDKILIIFFSILLLSPLALASQGYLAPYETWSFESNANNSTFEVKDSNAQIYLDNGVISLYTPLSKDIKKGTVFRLNVSWDISPTTITAGIRVLIDNDTLLKNPLSGKNEAIFEIFALKDYKKGEKFTIIVYNLGGNMHLNLKPLKVEAPKGSMSTGLLLTGIGISVVFLVLGILATVMYAMKPHKKELPEEKGGMPLEKKVEKKEKRENDEETVAAITGAVYLYLRGKKFRIVSVKPSPWKYYGRIARLRRWK